ncbi:MAG: hypothetical protein RI972_565, partial [Pseudomonadota bacterium]
PESRMSRRKVPLTQMRIGAADDHVAERAGLADTAITNRPAVGVDSQMCKIG